MRNVLAIAVFAVPLGVAAEPVLRAPRTAVPGDFVAAPAPTRDHITFARKLLPATGTPANALAESRIIYLNHTGVTLRPGDDDARTNHSSIVSFNAQVPAWNTSAANWAATVACFKDLWKEFDVVITDEDPGNVPHMEAVFGGYPQDVGMGQGVGGVSPFTLDCSVIENSIVFTFTEVFPDDPQTICEVMAQEVAHSYGLDHEMLASDPMTYLNYNGKRTFKNQLVSCGEFSNRPCGIGGSVCRQKQNSVALLKERAGTADLVPPTLGITFPADGATVPPGFEVAADATDNVAVVEARLFLDDAPAGTVAGAGPYTFPTDAALADGPHTIRVEVTDGKNTQMQTIAVTVQRAPDGNGSGSGSDGDDDTTTDGDVDGGCATSSGAGLALALAALALALARRRAR